MKCLNPIIKKIPLSLTYRKVSFANLRKFLSSPNSYIRDKEYKYLELSCGKCVFCLQQKVNEWSMRIKHELMFKRTGMFITLTYNNDNIPRTYNSEPKIIGNKAFYTDTTLVKADLQKFFKRLRYYLKDKKIKYYACGEYGEHTDRAHYHAIILGLDCFNLKDRELIKKSWTLGHIHFGNATVASGRYVAKYCNKVHEDYDYKQRYIKSDREPPFKLSSLGLGKQYVEEEKENIYNNLYIQNSQYKTPIPRTYFRWLQKIYIDIKDKLKEKTQKFKETRFYNLLSHYSDQLSELNVEKILQTVRKITRLNVVLKNHFYDELDTYSLSYYPVLYDLYYKSLLRKAEDLKIKEKRKIDTKKTCIF